ncbi:hypothetical protein [Flagellimonas flava]|uniref:Uncharacterized protein n=1 Tax=Flagellimonas flava TaxID=570519 RepID=A0A1M5KX49_9FLAO|nr:hypothetical protein [Allomuricauda flava]SHG57378.1 hypothetical protein SAMN04488116_1834 [Allomuricauda flava]
MKKGVLFTALIATVLFTGCSKDDDNGGGSCRVCSIELLGVNTSTEYCDNGDGTLTATTDGQEETVDLDGVSFDTFINQLDVIADCN